LFVLHFAQLSAVFPIISYVLTPPEPSCSAS